MGLQDRNYYDKDSDPWSRDPDFWKSGQGGIRRRKIVTIIIIINALIFLLDAFTPIPTDMNEAYKQRVEEEPQLASKISKPAHWLSSTMALSAELELWTPVTLLSHGFAHASIDSNRSFFHVGFNMLILFFLGRPVEQKYGRDEFLRIYLLAIVVAGIGWLLAQQMWGPRRLDGSLAATAVGASGAVTAIVALFVFNFPREKIYLWGILAIPAWLLGILVVGGDMLTALNPESHVAWEAHIAGFAFGTAYFFLGWKFSWLKFGWLNKIFSAQPKLKVHDPVDADDRLQEQADAILDKIANDGEGSLTAKERKILNKYSENLRKNRDP